MAVLFLRASCYMGGPTATGILLSLVPRDWPADAILLTCLPGVAFDDVCSYPLLAHPWRRFSGGRLKQYTELTFRGQWKGKAHALEGRLMAKKRRRDSDD